MAAVTICSVFGPPKIKSLLVSIVPHLFAMLSESFPVRSMKAEAWLPWLQHLLDAQSSAVHTVRAPHVSMQRARAL